MTQGKDTTDSEHQELRESFIESLLQSAIQPLDHSVLIDSAMNQIEDGQRGYAPQRPLRPSRRFIQWGSLAVATAIFLALFVQFGDSESQAAMAAIERSMNAAAEPIARKYLLRVTSRHSGGESSSIDNNLYVQGTDRFALRHPTVLPGSYVWLGQDGAETWVVPPVGPILLGDGTFLSKWLRSRGEVDTPYLHVSTILSRMVSRGYQLDALEDEKVTIADGTVIRCEHIRARIQSNTQPDGPKTIDLWANRETGMAVRLVASWNLSAGKTGRDAVEFIFVSDEPSLTDNWFTPSAHYQGRRAVFRQNLIED